ISANRHPPNVCRTTAGSWHSIFGRGFLTRFTDGRPLVNMLLPILSLIIFLVTMALAISFLYFFVDTPLSRRKMRARLAAIQEIQARNEEVPDILRNELLSDVPFINRILEMAPGISRLRLFLEQGAIKMQVGTFVWILVALPMFTFILTLALGRPIYQCAVA